MQTISNMEHADELKKNTNLIMSKTRTKEHYGFAKLMFSGDGQRKVN